jgi:hypothetical protein
MDGPWTTGAALYSSGRFEWSFMFIVFALVLAYYGVPLFSAPLLAIPALFISLPMNLLGGFITGGMPLLLLLAGWFVLGRYFIRLDRLFGEDGVLWMLIAYTILMCAH